MSYCPFPIVIDVDELRAKVGSKDSNLLASIELADSEDLQNPIRQLIMGELLDGEAYGYALIEICRHVGTPLLVDYCGAVRWETVEECGLDGLLTSSASPIPLPDYSDFPSIGHILRKDLQTCLDAAEAHRDEVDDDKIEEMLDEFIGWLGQAQSHNPDVVLCYH